MQLAAHKGETIMQVRVCCINQVLGTDMKKHFDITSRFQASLSAVPSLLWHISTCLDGRKLFLAGIVAA